MCDRRFLNFLLVAPFFTGCFAKADPAPGSGFLPVQEGQMTYSLELPFQKVWWDPKVNFKQYQEIYIAPVNTDYLLQMGWWQELERGSSLQNDLPDLASFAQSTFREAFAKDPKKRFRVVNIPHEETLVLRLALTEIIPTKTSLKLAGLIPGFFIPAKIAGLGSRSTAAFEARFHDGPNGRVIAMFADREAAKMSIVNAKDFTWYGHAKGMIQEWAEQFVQVANKEKYQVVKDSSRFELKPW